MASERKQSEKRDQDLLHTADFRIQTTKRIARGYRNVNNFIAMCYLRNGHLDIRF